MRLIFIFQVDIPYWKLAVDLEHVYSPVGGAVEYSNQCPGYNTKPSDGKAPVFEFWGVWSTPSLPLIPRPPWPEMAVPFRSPSMGQIELFNHLTVHKQITNVE